jgi:hypothetical protein
MTKCDQPGEDLWLQIPTISLFFCRLFWAAVAADWMQAEALSFGCDGLGPLGDTKDRSRARGDREGGKEVTL